MLCSLLPVKLTKLKITLLVSTHSTAATKLRWSSPKETNRINRINIANTLRLDFHK